jgi:mono/diheme cytochrome c family protein
MTAFRLFAAATALLCVASLSDTIAQIRPAEAPPLIIKSTYGADLYRFYCANCHGATARGAPARSSLHPAAPDLTILARRNNGVFPRDRVRDTLLHGPKAPEMPAHGTADMPVWGTIFRGLDASDAMGEIRVENLVQYIASLQEGEGAGGAHQP